MPNATQVCSCGELRGRAVCDDTGAWTACTCDMHGGAGAADVSAAADDGGVGADPPGNHSALRFTWLHTPPGSGSATRPCSPGKYLGSYQQIFTDSISHLPVPVTGPLTIGLEAAQHGEFLMTAEGSMFEAHFLQPVINVVDMKGTFDPATATISGTVVSGAPTWRMGTGTFTLELQP